jgi:hypothetical protein
LPIHPNPAERTRVVAAAMAFPLDDVVARYRRETDSAPDVAADLERELRRYLAICALYPDTRVPMKGPVDELWHLFITFTHDYAEFCRQVAGRFIHHVPARQRPTATQRAHDASLFASLYRHTFDMEPSEIWWPEMARRRSNGADCGAGCGGGCGGDGCGGCCGGCGCA